MYMQILLVEDKRYYAYDAPNVPLHTFVHIVHTW